MTQTRFLRDSDFPKCKRYSGYGPFTRDLHRRRLGALVTFMRMLVSNQRRSYYFLRCYWASLTVCPLGVAVNMWSGLHNRYWWGCLSAAVGTAWLLYLMRPGLWAVRMWYVTSRNVRDFRAMVRQEGRRHLVDGRLE